MGGGSWGREAGWDAGRDFETGCGRHSYFPTSSSSHSTVVRRNRLLGGEFNSGERGAATWVAAFQKGRRHLEDEDLNLQPSTQAGHSKCRQAKRSQKLGLLMIMNPVESLSRSLLSWLFAVGDRRVDLEGLGNCLAALGAQLVVPEAGKMGCSTVVLGPQ